MGSLVDCHLWVAQSRARLKPLAAAADGAGCHDLHFLSVEFYASFFTLLFHFHQEAFEFFFTFCHKGCVICMLLLLLLLLSHFSRVQLRATPETAAHQAPLSLGFSRQEHWSGLPFPSPMPESEK